jgi:negative regulator of flagellin synthesis FlgM
MAIEINSRATAGPATIKISQKPGGVDNEIKVAAETTSLEKGDSVALTSVTQEIKKAFSTSTAPVDMDRVNAVKKAVADGSYSVNAEKVAKKMIQFEQLMPSENYPDQNYTDL